MGWCEIFIKDVEIELDDEIIDETNETLEDLLEMLISDEISNKYGYCHFGWESHEIVEGIKKQKVKL